MQMKEAKTKVDAHRRANLEMGSMVKRDVIAWNQAAHEEKDAKLKDTEEAPKGAVPAYLLDREQQRVARTRLGRESPDGAAGHERHGEPVRPVHARQGEHDGLRGRPRGHHRQHPAGTAGASGGDPDGAPTRVRRPRPRVGHLAARVRGRAAAVEAGWFIEAFWPTFVRPQYVEFCGSWHTS